MPTEPKSLTLLDERGRRVGELRYWPGADEYETLRLCQTAVDMVVRDAARAMAEREETG